MPDPEAPPATILVVEDEEEVRALARDLLEMNGFHVLEAPDVAYLHVHNAKRGCYAARVDRA